MKKTINTHTVHNRHRHSKHEDKKATQGGARSAKQTIHTNQGCDRPLTNKEAKAAAPADYSVCGEEDPGASIEFLVSSSFEKDAINPETNKEKQQ